MTRNGVLAAAVVALCLAASATAQSRDCAVAVETVWLGRYEVMAVAAGQCGDAELTIEMVDPDLDQVAHSATFHQSQVFGFDEAVDAASTEVALQEWTAYATVEGASVLLPAWREGEEFPEAREFPFIPAEGLMRETYERARQEDWPTTCYIQGLESYLCLAENPDDAHLIELGYQLFPG